MTRDNERFTRDDERPPRPPAGAAREAVDDDYDEADARLIDLEADEESPFLRAQKRVPVRRGALPRKTAHRVKLALAGLTALVVVGGAAAVLYRYGANSWRFRIESGDHIQVAGTQNVSRVQAMEIFGGDIGRNVFFVPLEERKKQLEEIPWVQSATVMRLLPNRIRVEVKERTPVAFARIGSRVWLVDASGVLMELPPKSQKKYSFPLILGMQDNEPLSTRAARMRIYTGLIRELDSEGARYSQDLSEVDLTDPEDVKALVSDPAGAVLVHLGSSDFLRRYKVYIAHVQQWRAQFQKLESVDLRYERQVIVNPDPRAPAAAPAQPAKGKLKQ